MKRIIWLGITAICVLAIATTANAGTAPPLTSTISATVGTVFSMEWEDNVPTANVTYAKGGPLPFTSIDPTESQVYADGHSATKADIALICKSNEVLPWGLKTSTAGLLSGKLLYYMDQPTVYDGTSGVPTDGALANPTPGDDESWPVFPEGTVIYTSGDDTINTPFGTYCGLSVAINPTGLASGSSPSGSITFTMTQSL